MNIKGIAKTAFEYTIHRHLSSTGHQFDFGKNKAKILDIEPK